MNGVGGLAYAFCFCPLLVNELRQGWMARSPLILVGERLRAERKPDGLPTSGDLRRQEAERVDREDRCAGLAGLWAAFEMAGRTLPGQARLGVAE